MSPLHTLHRLTRSSSVSLPHPCKLAVLFYLSTTRLNPITSTRRRLPLSSAPFCGHGELEIVSVKELADGFLHLSFGTPNRKEDLSSCCGEHLAGNLSIPKRLPSKFSKRSPIPVAAVRRKRQEKSSSKQTSVEAITPSVKETVKLSSRPKSCFLKRSPIPRVKNEMSQRQKVVSQENDGYARPPSVFVRDSPNSPSVAKVSKRRARPASSDVFQTEGRKDLPAVQATSSTGSSSRPKSSFFRRSPIVKGQHFPKGASSKSEPSSTILLGGRKSTSMEASAKIQDTTETSTHFMVDLDKRKLSELKDVARLKGVKGYSKLKKAELLDVLKNLDA